MNPRFQILPERGIVYVCYAGQVLIQDSITAFAAYMAHPDCRPGQKHLVDLSQVTMVEQDYTRFLQLQALKAEQFVGQPVETMLAYFAPTAIGQRMAAMVLRSWEGLDHIVARVLVTERETLSFLGQPEARIEDLLSDRV